MGISGQELEVIAQYWREEELQWASYSFPGEQGIWEL